MTLYEGEKGCAYKVRNMRMEESLMRRLQALGLNEGTSIRVLNRKRRGGADSVRARYASGGRKTYQRAY